MTPRLSSGTPPRKDPLENHKVWLWLFPTAASVPWIKYCLSINDLGGCFQ